MGRLHGLTKLLYGGRVDRSEPIWPPDEVIGMVDDTAAPEPAPSTPPDAPPPDAVPRAGPWASTHPTRTARASQQVASAPAGSRRAASAPIAPVAGADLDSVPHSSSPWAQPPRTVRPDPLVTSSPPEAVGAAGAGMVKLAPGVARMPEQSGWSEPNARRSRYRGADVAPGVVATHHSGRIAVISGTASAGRSVAKLLAAALDRDRQGSVTVSDAGSVIDAPAWTTAVVSATQIVLAVDAVGTGPAEAARTLDRIEHAGNDRLTSVMTVVLLPPPRRGLSRGHEDIGAIRAHFAKRTRAVLFVPNNPHETAASQAAWARVVATVAE
jgi:hypothetical protein